MSFSKAFYFVVGLVLFILARGGVWAEQGEGRSEEMIWQRSACSIKQLLVWQPAPLVATVKDGAFVYEYGYFKDEMRYTISRNVSVTLEWKGAGRVEESRIGAGKVVSRKLVLIRNLQSPIRHKLAVLRPAAVRCLENYNFRSRR